MVLYTFKFNQLIAIYDSSEKTQITITHELPQLNTESKYDRTYLFSKFDIQRIK